MYNSIPKTIVKWWKKCTEGFVDPFTLQTISRVCTVSTVSILQTERFRLLKSFPPTLEMKKAGEMMAMHTCDREQNLSAVWMSANTPLQLKRDCMFLLWWLPFTPNLGFQLGCSAAYITWLLEWPSTVWILPCMMIIVYFFKSLPLWVSYDVASRHLVDETKPFLYSEMSFF